MHTKPTSSIAPPTSARFCIIGAGSSGLAVARSFRASGIAADVIEREDDVGGNWYFRASTSRIYRSTRLISSKRETEFADFPMPAEWPEHPRHEQIWQYLRDYARHFHLYEQIEFGRCVQTVTPAATNAWDVVLDGGERRRYAGLVIANGHNWDPRWPDLPGRFAGTMIHSGEYKAPEPFRAQRVLVVGGGNSGYDIAADLAPHAAEVLHSMRRAYHVLPRFLRGRPIDQCGQWALRWRVPAWLRQWGAEFALRNAWPQEVRSRLPRPDHRLYETHPVINSRWPYAVAEGKITLKPDVRKLDNHMVEFADGSRSTIDVIVCATGYKLSFPFIDAAHLNWHDRRPQLFLNVFHPERDDVFVAGLIQPDSGQFGLVGDQARLIALYVAGLRDERRAALRLRAEKRRNAWRAGSGIRYLDTPRHLVEVEHVSYRRALRRHIRRLGG